MIRFLEVWIRETKEHFLQLSFVEKVGTMPHDVGANDRDVLKGGDRLTLLSAASKLVDAFLGFISYHCDGWAR